MIRALAVLIALTGAAQAQTAAESAQFAAEMLEEASVRLDQADEARDRVAALTETIRAFESGLGALRDGVRAARIRELAVQKDLQGREAEIAQLLGVLQTISRTEGPAVLVHPAGPVGAARSGMMVAAVTPGLAAQAQDLKRDLQEVSTLRQLQEAAVNQLRQGLNGVQTARTQLSQAIAERTDLPRRFTEDPVRTAILIGATETLQAFASGLSEIAVGDTGEALPGIDDQRGLLPLPVPGQILRAAGEADAAGVVRPGILIATRAQALVTTPVPVTVRYSGPLLDYGLVTILEPQEDTLFVFAGLATVFGAAGEVLPAGSPVGLMGGSAGNADDILSQSGERTGSARPETLYIEVREGDGTVDPLIWFTTDKG